MAVSALIDFLLFWVSFVIAYYVVAGDLSIFMYFIDVRRVTRLS